MTKTSYVGNTIFLEPEIQPDVRKKPHVVQAVAEHRAPKEPPPGILQIKVASMTADEQATWNILLVPNAGVAYGSSTRRSKFDKWVTKLESLSRLQVGWDSYTAPKPSLQAIRAAKSYLSVLELVRWEPTRVEASVMGGVGITHRQGVRKVYVEFYNDGRVHALFSDRTPNMHTTPVGADIQSYYRFIGKAREYLNG